MGGIWELLVWIYDTIVYKPQLNLLEAFYQLTDDIGWAIVILALLVNLLLWPLFGRSYVNTQKMRLLQPQIREIQEKYKSSPQDLIRETRAFYDKHKIRNSTTILILFFQILFATGLFRLTQAISAGEELTGLYPIFFENETAQFGQTAFGFLDITQIASTQIWLPLLAAFFSYLMGMYMFRWAPKPKLPEPKKKKPKKKTDDKPSPFDPEAFQKSLEVQSIYFFPIIIFFTNYFLTVGVSIYFVTVNILALARQIFMINFYRTHEDKLVEDITKSDPSSQDDDPSNNLEADVDPASETEQPVAAKTIKTKGKKETSDKKKSKTKTSTKSKKSSKK